MRNIAQLEAVLEKQRLLEEQKLLLQQEQGRLTLETELAKSKAEEQVLSSTMEAAPGSFVPNPISLVGIQRGWEDIWSTDYRTSN